MHPLTYAPYGAKEIKWLVGKGLHQCLHVPVIVVVDVVIVVVVVVVRVIARTVCHTQSMPNITPHTAWIARRLCTSGVRC